MFFVNWLNEHAIVLNTLILAALVAGSWLLGEWMSKVFRAPDYGWKFGCIFFALFASIVVIYRGWPPRLGIDLGGGTILVYRVDPTATDWHNDKMDSLVAAINERVNPGGQKEISVRSLGNDMVQIIMPAPSGATSEEKRVQAEEIKKIIRTTGALEFRIVATRRFDQTLIERAKATRLQSPGTEATRIIRSAKGKAIAEWCRVRDKEADKIVNDDAAIDIPDGKDKEGKETHHTEVLVLAPESESYNVTGKYIRDATAHLSQESAGYEVEFKFNPEGGQKFGRLTGEHVPLDNGAFHYKLAIILDHILMSAPNLNDRITDSGRITGDFDQKEAQDLADIINRGSLPAALNPNPEREMVTDPTLGADTIHQSLLAMLIAAIAVPVFMIYYYRFAGVVAVMVLTLTVIMLVAIMILVKAPFTLTALAGLALSVGMEVDNNVLIYERLREEIRHGAALRMALRNSFHRVGVVIVDANITHILAAAVLFYVGTEQVKGFAITFLLGALLSIWATMFVARTIFEVAERRRFIHKINMKEWIGHTTIDFMHWFRVCLTFSILITVLGLVVAVVRGKGLFDIDFTGGISVQTVFRQAADIKEIRAAIAKNEKALPDATVTNVQSQDEPKDHRFVFDTSNTNGNDVQKLIQEIFGNQLVTAQMTYEVTGTAGPLAEKPPEKPTEKPAAASPAASAPKVEPKPSVPPVDMSLPKPETKTTGAKPVEAKPAAPKATGAPPVTPKQSQSDLPPPNMVAMVGPEAVLLAQADTPQKKADVNPQAKTDATSAAKLDAKPQAKPEVKPKAAPETKPQPVPEAKPEAKPVSETPPSEPVATHPVHATLSFEVNVTKVQGANTVEQSQKAKYAKDKVNSLIEQALEARGIPAKSVQLDLKNSADAEAADQWEVTLQPVGAAKIALTPDKVKAVLDDVKSAVAKQAYFPGVDSMGSAVAKDTRFWACVALVLSWSLIILYLWIRFQGVAFGLAAVIALIHDVLVMLGAVAFSSYLALIPGVTTCTLIEPFKINLTIVAAFLTIIGYSVNDTIVVFDRIREIRGKSPTLTRQMVNDATNQTLSRTVLTSLTVLMVVVILYVAGGQAVHGFAFALIIGVLTGTYSSIYVAAPILLWLLHPKEMKVSTASGSSRQGA